MKKLKLHIFLTMKTKVDTLASFLFWRAFKLYEQRKLEDVEGGSIYSNPLTDGPVQINFGRPDFEGLFNEIAVQEPYIHYVYGCAPDMITSAVNSVCAKI